ncbi:MAG TPA: hypothetical protein VGL72_01980, partial [Bryobacteraceae bacterium]
LDAGVTYLGADWSTASSINTSYTPGSTFSGVNIPVQFEVTGTSAPEPGTFAIAAIGLTVLLLGLVSPKKAKEAPASVQRM